MDWRCGLSGRAPALQVSSNPSPTKKKKKKRSSMGLFLILEVIIYIAKITAKIKTKINSKHYRRTQRKRGPQNPALIPFP
jgi:hypothetical protein